MELNFDQKNQIEKLSSAAFTGDEKILRAIIDNNKEKWLINGLNSRGQTPLYCAARGAEQSHFACVVTLISVPGIDLDIAITPHNGTALHAAAYACNVKSVAVLLIKGANPDLKNSAGLTPLEDINFSNDKSSITAEVFHIFKKKKATGLLDTYPELATVLNIDRKALITSTQGTKLMNEKNLDAAKERKEDESLVKKISTREESEMKKLLLQDQHVRNQLKYKIRKEIRQETAPFRRELLNPPLLTDIMDQIFPGGERKKNWRYMNDFGILSSSVASIDLEVVFFDNTFYLCYLLNIVSPEDIIDFVILGNQFIQENNNLAPIIDFGAIRGSIIAYTIIPKALTMAKIAKIDVFIRSFC